MGVTPQSRCFCARPEDRRMAGLTCYSDADLRAFLLGDLPEKVAQTVSTHLETCPDCEAAARRLDRLTDSVIQGLRRVLAPGPADGRTATAAQNGTGGPTP